MCILLKLHYANFDASRLFCSKIIEEKPLGGRVKEGLTLSGPGGGLRGPDGQTHSCQSETSYPMMPRLGDF